MILNVKIKQKHIDRGQPESCSSCPIALALQREAISELGRDVAVYVDETSAELLDKQAGTLYTSPLPYDAQHFIARFDNYRDVEPFTFELSLEEAIIA